jgi:hypothetical protein
VSRNLGQSGKLSKAIQLLKPPAHPVPTGPV